MGIQYTAVVSGPGPALATTAEGVLITVPAITLGHVLPFGIIIRGWLTLATSAGSTALALRSRIGTLVTGTALPVTHFVNCGASTTIIVPFLFQDLSSEAWDQVGGTQYVITGQMNGATGNSTLQNYGITVEI